MFKHALVAIDFSAGTTRLLSRLRMLRGFGVTRATLTHVLSTRYPYAPSETHRAEYEDRLAKMAAELTTSGIETEASVVVGDPGHELVRVAGRVHADLILAGKTGEHRLRAFLLGSTALNLARLTDRPLWLEPIESDADDFSSGDLHCVLLATDGSNAARLAEEMFVRLIPKAQRGIALHVVPGRDGDAGERRETTEAGQLLADLKSRSADVETVIQSGDPTAEIAEIAERESVDLIVVGKRGRSRIRGLLLGSTAEAVCRRSRRPVLLVPGGPSGDDEVS